QAEDGIRDPLVTGVQTCALPIFVGGGQVPWRGTHSRISMSVSAFFGFSLPMAVAVTLHLPGLFPCFLVLTVAVNAPHARLVPSRSEERRVGKECRARWRRQVTHK